MEQIPNTGTGGKNSIITGNTTGNITGNSSGSTTGGMTGSTAGRSTGATGNMTGNMTGSANGNMTGNNTGTMTGGTTGNMTGSMTGTASCRDGYGCLPSCGLLANPYVPFQPTGAAKYSADRGIVRGTLFPGLDLPFMNMVNASELPDTPLNELMALDFAIKELQLYLDTHPDDEEALELLKSYISLAQEGRERYTASYGPISIGDVENARSYTWIRSPWPWEYTAGGDER